MSETVAWSYNWLVQCKESPKIGLVFGHNGGQGKLMMIMSLEFMICNLNEWW